MVTSVSRYFFATGCPIGVLGNDQPAVEQECQEA